MFDNLKESLKDTISGSSKEEEEDLEETKEEIESEETEEDESKGFVAKAKEKITKTEISEDDFEDLFWDLEKTLLENNVAVEVISEIKDNLKEELVEEKISRNVESEIKESLKNSLEEILSSESIDIVEEAKEKDEPLVIAFFGINGTGKTTTIAKVAKLLEDNNLSSVMSASDTFRAAAIDQIQEHADALDIKLIKHDYGADPAAVAYDSVQYAENNDVDAVLIDTAGRLHSDSNLMDELEKITRTVEPDIKVFVGESITGNDCIEQAKEFDESIGIDASILTKVDIDDKGGAALSISQVTGKPIIYLGTGQEYEDLEKFDPDKIIEDLGLEEE